jgi:NAD(P)-dependent dehydrogenase (short-subunit alcohol dehydrogenase family)
MDVRFDGKTVVVTGGARGIGFACAEMLSRSGARVVLVDVLADLVEESAKKLGKNGDAKGYQLDLGRISDIAPVVTKIRKEFGEIDVLIQAAGLLRAGCAENITEVEWDSVMNINSKALFFMMQAVASQSMIPRNTGSIVNFSSLAGMKGMKEPLCSAHYSASKGAVIAITRQAAVEWGKYNIRVNAVAPGGVKTAAMMNALPGTLEKAAELIPLNKLSEMSDIASGVCFLASGTAAAMVTGHVLVIDGGGFVVGF